jgi:FtsP/CotA-like multicopper oxidase with cupredoxin domain
MRHALLAGLLVLLGFESYAETADTLPVILANQNHTPAGVLHNGVLLLQLEIAKGIWHPEAEDGMALSVYAFGETGGQLLNPGPLIRVPQGTEVRVSLHNALDVPVSVHGLANPATTSEIRLQAKGNGQATFVAATPGLSFYWASTEVDDLKLRHGIDSELTGALVVDPPGSSRQDEIFVLEMISERPGAAARQTLATINGKSWPYTQRFRYARNESVRWRWVNASNEPHALHLHGFYYRVEAFNRGGQIQTYSDDTRPQVVTQRIAQGETFDMSWVPERPGQWLFHCHMLQHMNPPVVPPLPGLTLHNVSPGEGGHSSMAENAGMGQLVLGITVPGITEDHPWRAERKLQLDINERNGPPRYAMQVRDASQKAPLASQAGLIGPPIVLTRGQPTEIEIINHLKDPTAIHWHGIELESYYDGVPGWSGADRQITPPIAPGTSFVARITPPRAGTFIYHTHWHDALQLTNGLYGPLIVMPPSEQFDPSSDLPFVFSIGDFGDLHEMALINGTPEPKNLPLKAGKKYRFRFINISTNNQGMQVSLENGAGLVEWKIIGKDGAELPISTVHPSKAQLTITVGETYDVEFVSDAEQDLLLDLLRPALKMHTSQTLSFQNTR